MSPSAAEGGGGAVEAAGTQWDVDMEIQLFYAMAKHKPVGINKHFEMACIWHELNESITKEISSDDIWHHLDTLYDIPMLDDTEPLPFPNDDREFTLPENEFSAHIKQKCIDAILSEDTEEPALCPSPVPKSSTPKSGSRAASKDNTPRPRKESAGAGAGAKSRKESGSSHASTDTPTNKSDKDYGARSDRRRDSRDSNASGRENSAGRKSSSNKEKTAKSRTGSAVWGSASEEADGSRRGRRRPNTSTPPATAPAKRRRT